MGCFAGSTEKSRKEAGSCVFTHRASHFSSLPCLTMLAPKDDDPTLIEELSLSAQLSAFRKPSEFGDFFARFFRDESMASHGSDSLKALTFQWFRLAKKTLNCAQFNAATAIARGINARENITNPLALDNLS